MPFGHFNSMPQKGLPENQTFKNLAFSSLFRHFSIKMCDFVAPSASALRYPLLHFSSALFTIPVPSTLSFHPHYFQIVALPCFSIPIIFYTMHHHPGGGYPPPLFPFNHFIFNCLRQKRTLENPLFVPLFISKLSLLCPVGERNQRRSGRWCHA